MFGRFSRLTLWLANTGRGSDPDLETMPVKIDQVCQYMVGLEIPLIGQCALSAYRCIDFRAGIRL